jgi:hypothetical protein
MTFNTHLHPAQRESSHTWSITFHFLPHDHPQKTAILKVVDSFKYLGVPIDKDLPMCTLHTQILDNIQKANGKLQGLLRDLKSNRKLNSSHHLGQASTSPKTIGGLGRRIHGSVEDTKLSTRTQQIYAIGFRLCWIAQYPPSRSGNPTPGVLSDEATRLFILPVDQFT